MARGYPGAFGRKLNAPYVWIPLCVAVPRALRRRPAAAAGCCTWTCSCCSPSAPRTASSIAARSGSRRRSSIRCSCTCSSGCCSRRSGRAAPPGPLVPHAPLMLLVVGLVFLTAFRIGLNVADSNVIDVGYAGVIGADRIADGDHLYGEGFSADVETRRHLRAGHLPPLRALRAGAAVERALGRPAGRARRRDRVRPAGARRACCCSGGGCARAARATALGVALAYAWAAYPYTAFVLESNSNDTLVARGLHRRAARGDAWRATGPSAAAAALARRAGRGGEVRDGRAGAAVRAPRRRWSSRARSSWLWRWCVVPFVPDGGVRELYDRTIGYQASRPSPFSVWGQVESLGWLQDVAKAAAGALALAGRVRPATARACARSRRSGRRS